MIKFIPFCRPNIKNEMQNTTKILVDLEPDNAIRIKSRFKGLSKLNLMVEDQTKKERLKTLYMV